MSPKEHWLLSLVEILNTGCSNSQFIIDLKAQKDTKLAGKELSINLWPFISTLPQNIKSVKQNIPDSMDYAKKFFAQLQDDEGFYQGLYKQQCVLAGIELSELDEIVADKNTLNLCSLMNQYCTDKDYKIGIFIYCYSRTSPRPYLLDILLNISKLILQKIQIKQFLWTMVLNGSGSTPSLIPDTLSG